MKLYVHPLSTPALGAELAARAMNIDFEKKVVDLASGEQRSADYLAINPRGKVPALEDDGFKLAESMAIMRYLARKEKSELYPSDLQSRAKVEQWMDFAAQHVRAPLARIQFNRLIAPMLGQTPDEASIKVGEHLLAESLPIAESQLSDTDFVCGDALTLADLTLLSSLDPVEALSVDLAPYPHIAKWRKDMRARSFYTDIHTHFGAELGL